MILRNYQKMKMFSNMQYVREIFAKLMGDVCKGKMR